VKSYVSIPELRNAVKHSNLKGVPGAAYGVPTLNIRSSLDMRINIRAMLPNRPGRFGDGIIGAQALENNMPLVTNDKELRIIVEALGGTTR
jgi:predicted nucleic acid-binding protein